MTFGQFLSILRARWWLALAILVSLAVHRWLEKPIVSRLQAMAPRP